MADKKPNVKVEPPKEVLDQAQSKASGSDGQSKFKYDKLRMYFGEPYTIKCGEKELNILQPHIGDILEFGEQEFLRTVRVFTTNSTENRVMLWSIQKNWNTISDFEVFLMLLPSVDQRVVDMLFDDFKIEQFVVLKSEDGKFILLNKTNGIVITEDEYERIADYIRTIFGLFPKVEKVKGKFAQKVVIDDEIKKIKKREGEPPASFLLPLMSFYKCHPGTNYTKEQLRDIGIYELMYDLRRLQVYESSRALMTGMYSGFVDGKKIKPEDYNMMRDV